MNDKGFTLVEILVVTALLAVLITLGVGIFLSNSRFYENQTGKTLAINAVRESAERINEFTRSAEALETSHLYNSINYSTDSDTLILRVPAIDASGDIVAGVHDFVIVNASSTRPELLELIVDADPASNRLQRYLLLTGNLSSINFTYDNADPALVKNLRYEIVVTETGRNPVSETITGGATLRN